MKEVALQLPALPLTDDIEWLANKYVRYGEVPESYLEDAYHIAVAVMNEMDCISSDPTIPHSEPTLRGTCNHVVDGFR